MIDSMTQKRLLVDSEGATKPSVKVPVSQLDEIKRILDSAGFRYYVEENYLSFNGGPFNGWIVFARGTDPNTIQALLDDIS